MILGICGFCKKEFRKRERKYKFCSLFCSNRFNLNHLNVVQLPVEGKELAEFIGICLGDGYTSKYQVGVTLNSIADRDYIAYVFNLSNILFPGATISKLQRKGENAIDIRISSRVVADFLREMGIVPNAKYVPKWILENHDYIKACMKGLFDTEGSISFKKYTRRDGESVYKQLNFRNANVALMKFVRDSLVQLGLRPTMTLRRSLYLSTHDAIDIFREKVGFSNPKLQRRSLIKDIRSYHRAMER